MYCRRSCCRPARRASAIAEYGDAAAVRLDRRAGNGCARASLDVQARTVDIVQTHGFDVERRCAAGRHTAVAVAVQRRAHNAHHRAVRLDVDSLTCERGDHAVLDGDAACRADGDSATARPSPLIVRPCSVTSSPDAPIAIASPLETVTPAKAPAAAMIATDRSSATPPYPAESTATISPPPSVRRIAAGNERHGCVIVHGPASLPVDAMNVRGAASAGSATHQRMASATIDGWIKRRLLYGRGRRR